MISAAQGYKTGHRAIERYRIIAVDCSELTTERYGSRRPHGILPSTDADGGIWPEMTALIRSDHEKDWGKAFYINDPDGNRIELCTKSGFGVLV
jgi:hypothetical protein